LGRRDRFQFVSIVVQW